jgi:hypothetical protein
MNFSINSVKFISIFHPKSWVLQLNTISFDLLRDILKSWHSYLIGGKFGRTNFPRS